MSGMLAALVLGHIEPSLATGTATAYHHHYHQYEARPQHNDLLVPRVPSILTPLPPVPSTPPLAMQRHRLLLFLTMLLVPKGSKSTNEETVKPEEESQHYHDEQIATNQIAINNELKALLSRPLGSTCPKWLNCTEGYFDEGKDCNESAGSGRCTCIAHCCLAFDCRDWGQLVGCRRRCGSPAANRFGLTRTERVDCAKYTCERLYHDPTWDSRGADEKQRHCIAHCCYAFDCRKTLGYCRHACGVDTWITARPLG